MKIALISHSDSTGGAAIVTRRLLHALRGEGVDAEMLVSHRASSDPHVHPIGTPLGRRARFLSERLHIFAANGLDRRDLFKVDIATRGYDLARHPLVAGADAIIIGWINQGTLSLSDIARIAALGRPTAWVQHDMWAFTGICHHALACGGYRRRCGSCPFIHLPGSHERDLSARTYSRKKALYDSLPESFHIVAVSRWLAERAAGSSLLGGRRVDVIPNPIPVDDFHFTPRRAPIYPGRRIILMGAARLDDPIKGLPDAIAALNALAEQRPDIAADTIAIFFGHLRDRRALDTLRFPHEHLGPVTDPALLRELYAQSAVTLSTSLFETLPGTLIEGMAAGSTPVSFLSGGQLDIIDPDATGYLAETPRDTGLMARTIARALDRPLDRPAQHAAARRRFAPPAIARAYLSLLS